MFNINIQRVQNICMVILLLVLANMTYAFKNDCLLVHLKNGQTMAFPIEKSPQITFEDGVLIISTERFQIKNVAKYTFVDSESLDVEDVKSANTISFMSDGDILKIRLKDVSLPIKMYTISGMEIAISKDLDEKGLLSINMASLREPVYLIKIGDETIKIRKP